MVGPSSPFAQPGAELVDSLAHPLAVWLREVLNAAPEPCRLIIDDEENILQALSAGVRVERVFHTEDQPVSWRLQRALPLGATYHTVAKRTSKKLFATSKLSRTFAVAQTRGAPLLDAFADLEKDIVALENPGISGNIGAIIRTAVAFGVGGLVLLDTAANPYDRRLIRASRGHIFSLPVVKTTTQTFLAFCRRHHRPLVVAKPHASTPVESLADLPGHLALAFGNEKEGCSRALTEAADAHVSIRTAPPVESLNVSTAAAITLFQRFGKR